MGRNTEVHGNKVMVRRWKTPVPEKSVTGAKYSAQTQCRDKKTLTRTNPNALSSFRNLYIYEIQVYSNWCAACISNTATYRVASVKWLILIDWTSD